MTRTTMSRHSRPAGARVGWVAAAVLPLVLAGCTDAEHTRPADIAVDVLTQRITDATMVSGFTISETRITLTSGEPPATAQIYPEPDEAVEPAVEPAHPPHVQGSELDVADVSARAVDSLKTCGEEWGMVEVQVISAGAVATRTTCEEEGQEAHTVALNDEVLETVTEPISGETLALVWGEIESAGLAEDVISVSLDRSEDVARVMFTGPSPDRTYEWDRGLTVANSQVLSHSSAIPGSLDLGTLTADVVATALDEQVDALGGPDGVERALIQPTPDGGADLVLTDAEYMPLVTVALP